MQNHIDMISSGVVVHWTVHDWVEGQSNPVDEWHGRLSDAAKLQFNALFKNICKEPNHLFWGGFKFPKGELRQERIWQLDFVADKKQYRVLGIFGGVQRQLVLLEGLFHKGKVYTPPNAFENAIKRAKRLREKKASTRERKIRFDL